VRGDRIEFDDLRVSSLIGRLEGYFIGEQGKTRRFGGYAFVIPDRHELKEFLTQSRKDAKFLLGAE
jgi:hypothetical protein